MKYVVCNNVRYHFVQVPGYIFVVDEVNRLGNNSGYLINTLIKTKDIDKLKYIDQLLGTNGGY